MVKNIVLDNVVPASVSLEDKEGYAVDLDGVLTTTLGDYAKGVVYEGRPAGEASVIVIHGQCTAKVYGSSDNVAKGDPLCAGSTGVWKKATVGTHDVRAHALEAVTTDTDALIDLI